uniref:Uncharacterized protein n=1 Tax=Triticum urartu TaxID=4572 RepID=A0A8R7TIG2_TRIUA
MEPPQVDPSRTLVHEPRADEPSPHETQVPEAPPHETLDQAMSQPNRLGDWAELSGHADGDEGGYSSDSYSESELVEGGNVYQHGGTKLPPTPATPDQRWLITPDGEKFWKHGRGLRRPNTVLGVICRQSLPGWVTLPGEGQVPELGITWEHYLAAPAPPGERIGSVECHMVADVVIHTFWTFYRCAEGQEEAATQVNEAECRRLLQNWQNGARTQATRDYFASIGIRMSKARCRTKYLSKDNYMKVITYC